VGLCCWLPKLDREVGGRKAEQAPGRRKVVQVGKPKQIAAGSFEAESGERKNEEPFARTVRKIEEGGRPASTCSKAPGLTCGFLRVTSPCDSW